VNEVIKVIVDGIFSPIANYAMQQNHVPIIKRLLIKNTSNQDLNQITLTIESNPDFISPYTKHIEYIGKEQVLDVGLLDLKLSPAFLASVTEKITGAISITVLEKEKILYNETRSIDVLAFDEWSGYTIVPEMISAFVTPNHPNISSLAVNVSQILGKWSNNPSLEGYQSKDNNRVKMQVAAVYAALQDMNIVYSVPPASFEISGQRVRLCDDIFTHKMATCLDLTLLFSSCLEAMGLNPLIVIVKGHAFVGAWLTDECFTESVQDDFSLLTKRIADGIHDICVVETTVLVAGQNISFDDACDLAIRRLNKEDECICFIDVRRTRASGIRPLPMRVLSPNGWEIKEYSVPREEITDAPAKMELYEKVVDVPFIPVTRQKNWERKLLDLSIRNTLLNFRITRSTVPVLTTSLGKLEDALADGEDFQILEKPSDWDNPFRDSKVFETRNNIAPINELLKFEFQQKRLRTPLTENELGIHMTNLYRTSKVSLEENGANTLYLALGFLKWFETAVSQVSRYAPLVLLPIEIIRKSSKRGYIIRSRDEEPHMNITLLEMLKQDFGIEISGLDPLPKDGQGIDLKRILNVIRQSVMNLPKWDVVEEAYLGIFSFNRFIMWNDIRNRSEDLAKNKVVASLLNGKLEWCAEKILDKDINLDEVYMPDELMLPISADSTQLRAICASNMDHSFVLHGPPGTGKSQTITNMIANALANGKTVLFVAEKMAALSVVQKRLEAIGLGPFCLELHSNKSKKKAVLEQLQVAAEVVKTISSAEYASDAKRLSGLRNELNQYIKALYEQQSYGLCLYDAISRFGKYKNIKDDINITTGVFSKMTTEQFAAWVDCANEVAVAGSEVGHPFLNPLQEIECRSYSQSLKSEAIVALQNLSEKTADSLQSLNSIDAKIVTGWDYSTPEQIENLIGICKLIDRCEYLPPSLLTAENVMTACSQLKTAAAHGEKEQEFRQKLLNVFSERVFTFDAQSAQNEWNRLSLEWFFPRWMGQNRILKALRQLADNSQTKIDKDQVPELLHDIETYQFEKQQLTNYTAVVMPLLNSLWNGYDTDWKKVHLACEQAECLIQLLGKMTDNRQENNQVISNLSLVLANNSSKKVWVDFILAYEQLKKSLGLVANLLGIDFTKVILDNTNWLEYLAEKIAIWSKHLEGLREWSTWLLTRDKAVQAGLEPLITAYEKGKLKNEEVVPAFYKAFYKSAALNIIANKPELNNFSGKLFEEKIRQFKETSERFEELTRKEIFYRLAAKLPDFTREASQNSELGILQKAIRSNARSLSLRKLFEQIPNLLVRLCPCMLMSPISVAQYLDPKTTSFDLVVFDEASQMPTCEAVGAIARGKNVIVVGDPRQLPPTNFFASNSVDEENFVIEDLESILDDCLALSMPEEHLKWHYRSKHESLISFSNMQYYDNKLMTFPSPNDLTSKVTLNLVDGFYDRGKTKQNKAEATAVVEEILRRLRDPKLSKLSIGVVTFNSIQQNLIDDLLSEAFRDCPELEEISVQSDEPIFIKNLENVQGDERDVILFSVGYGPDESGKVSLNFGPLNREGGWRRLNVAVSRARYEMIVFSTLRPEQIDIARTRAQGIFGLKAFLEYAQKGKNDFAIKETGMVGNFDAGISKLVADALQTTGYMAHVNVGCSGYKIDVAVLNPDKPNEYILGIMCDGFSCKSANTASDREVLQKKVLQKLGWSILHIRAVDWWENSTKEIQKIVQEIVNIKNGKCISETIGIVDAQVKSINVAEQIVQKDYLLQAAATTKQEVAIPYIVAKLPLETMSPEDICLPDNTIRILERIRTIIELESPISRSYLFKRVLQSYGILRVGARLERRFDELLAKLDTRRTGGGAQFIWKASSEPTSYAVFRISSPDTVRRNPEDLPPEEIAVAVKYVLESQISLPKQDLVRETFKVLGYVRSGTAIEAAVDSGIKIAIQRGWAEQRDHDRIILCS
jgi:hypothetical protein